MTSLHVSTLETFHYHLFTNENFSYLPSTNSTNDIITSNTNQLNWPILSLSILAIFGTLGNLLVCASISLDKQLQTVTNWFLFSLAIADCLVSVIVLPLSIIKDFQGSWQLPIFCCNIYVFLDVLLCTTSIWHLTVLSIDRFLRISRPFHSRERNKFKIFLTILFIWTFSIAISCTILILGFADKNNILIINKEDKRICALNNQTFIIYGSIICFCVPCILMIVTYSLTIRRLQKEAAKCYSDPDDHVIMMSQTSERLRRHRSNSKERTSTSSTQFSKPQLSKDLSSLTPIPTPASLRSPPMLEVDSKQNRLDWANSSISSSSGNNSNNNNHHHHHHHHHHHQEQRSFLHSTFVQKAVHAIKGGTETTSERRAMKVLGIVFFVFLVAWLPFSILNILSAVCPSCGVQPSLLNLTSWLGYISSNINPIIYTAFNVRFRRAFVSILTCQLNYFSHKRKRNNLYIFIASNNNHPSSSLDQTPYFHLSRRFPSKRNSFT